MPIQRLSRTALIAFAEFVIGPRSPFVGGAGGSLLLIGVAFELSRLFKIAVRALSSATG